MEWEKWIENYTTGMFKKRKEAGRMNMVRAGKTVDTCEEGKRKADPEPAGGGEGRMKKKRRYEVIKCDRGEKTSESEDVENKQCENNENELENICVNEEHTSFTAKVADSNGCGTAKDEFGKVSTCRPGQLIDKKENLEIDFGREVHNRGIPRPRPSGVSRGQGK